MTIARALFDSDSPLSLMIFLKIFANVGSGRSLHSLDESLIERLRGVDTGVAKEMIERNDLGDDCDVLPGVEEYGDLRKLHLEHSGRLDIETGSLYNCILIPLLELHDDLDALLLANGANTEDSRNVDQTDTTNLHVVPLHLVSATDQHIVAALADDNQIVRNKPVSPLHEIEDALRFTNSAHTREEETDSENVCEGAVKGGGGGELHLQHGLDPPVEFRGLELGAYERNSSGAGGLPEASRQTLSLRHEDSWNRKGEEELEDSFPLLSVKRNEI